MELQEIRHNFQPIFNRDSKVLMLGTMPSPKSRELGFYYGHPRNRFWKVLADVCGETVPETIDEKKSFAINHNIAVWDVLASCEIKGASDGSIKNPVANDLSEILSVADIKAIFTTGQKASELYRKYCFPVTQLINIGLPSTSPANCRTSYEELYSAYKIIYNYLQ